MLLLEEMVDAMQCILRFTNHAEARCVDRTVGSYNDIVEDIQAVGEDLLAYPVNTDINIVNTKANRTTCVVIKSDEDYNTLVIIKTVIDCNYPKKDKLSLIIN